LTVLPNHWVEIDATEACLPPIMLEVRDKT
jgi:hypothetical protein